jgi:hypothetical protein
MSNRVSKEGNGADVSRVPNESNGSPVVRLQRRGRRVRQDTGPLVSGTEKAVDKNESFLCAQMERRPYMTLATASGVGYVTGGGIPSRLTRLIIDMGTRVATAFMVQRFGGARMTMPPGSDDPKMDE